MAWYSSTPEGSKENRYTLEKVSFDEHCEDWDSFQPIFPETEGLDEYLNLFSESGICIQTGMGIVPLDWQELEAWNNVRDVPCTFYELLLIRGLSEAYINEYHAGNDKDRPQPYMPTPTEEQREMIAAKIKNIFASRMKQRKGL
jgi:hypothetical protein